MPVIPPDGIPHRHIPIVRTTTRKAMADLLRTGTLREGLPATQHPYPSPMLSTLRKRSQCYLS